MTDYPFVCRYCKQPRGALWHPHSFFADENSLKQHEIRCRDNPDRTFPGKLMGRVKPRVRKSSRTEMPPAPVYPALSHGPSQAEMRDYDSLPEDLRHFCKVHGASATMVREARLWMSHEVLLKRLRYMYPDDPSSTNT